MLLFLLCSLCFLVTSSEHIEVRLEAKDLAPSERTFCCGSVWGRCARACAGRSCSLKCLGYCGFLNSKCGPYVCSTVTNACTQPVETTQPTTDGETTEETTEGSTEATTGGSTEVTTGGSTEASTGGSTEVTTGGSTEVTTGETTEVTTGGSTEVTTGGSTE